MTVFTMKQTDYTILLECFADGETFFYFYCRSVTEVFLNDLLSIFKFVYNEKCAIYYIKR